MLLSEEGKMMVSGVLGLSTAGKDWNTWAQFLIFISYLLKRLYKTKF
jgi:hypothetical protein